MYPSHLEPAAYAGKLAEASFRLTPHLAAGEKLARRIIRAVSTRTDSVGIPIGGLM